MGKTHSRGRAPLRRLLAVLAVAIGVLAGGGVASAAGSEGNQTMLLVNAAHGVSGDHAVVSAGLYDITTFAPAAGQVIFFSAPSFPGCVGITDGTGVASCVFGLNVPAGTYPLTVSYGGDFALAASTGSAPLQVSAADASLTYTGPTGVVTAGTPVTLSAVLERISTPSGPLAGKSIALSLGSQTCTGVTDAFGAASCTISSVVQPAGATPVTAVFSEPGFYNPASASAAVTVFVPAPVSPVAFSTTPPAVSTVQTASFAWTSSVPFSRFECSLDGASSAACSSPRTYHGLAAGPHELCVRITTDPAAACWAWAIVSPGAPETTFTLTPPPNTSSRTASFTWTSDQPAPRYQCSLDGAAFAPCSSPRTYRGLALGTHTLRVRAINFAGDVDPTPATWTWTITP